MTRSARSTLTIAISLLLLFSLPELTCAQQPTAYGTWSGYFTYTETDYGTVIGEYSYAGMSTLTVDIFGSGPSPHGYYATLSGPPGFSGPGGSEGYELLSFCPTSASGLTEAGGYFGFYGSFDVTYQSILPDGEIDTTGGFAVADFSGQKVSDIGEFTEFTFWSASFTTASVPEPSAIVPMAIGAVVVGTWFVIGRRRAGKPLRPQPHTALRVMVVD